MEGGWMDGGGMCRFTNRKIIRPPAAVSSDSHLSLILGVLIDRNASLISECTDYRPEDYEVMPSGPEKTRRSVTVFNPNGKNGMCTSELKAV